MKHEFEVLDISCGHCKMRIEKALAASGAALSWSVDVATKKVTVETGAERSAIAGILKEAGYPPI